MRGRLLFWLAWSGLLASSAQAAGTCRVQLRASVELQRAGSLILAPVEVNGTLVDFVLDTGAERSVIGIAAAARLHLGRDEWVSTDVQGAGGHDRRRLGRPNSLSLGGAALRRHTVAADNSIVVGTIPDSVNGHPVAGLLGQDFLSPFDLDLDAPAGKLSLYEVSGCSGRFLPWTGRYSAMPAGRPVRNMLTLPLRVGGAVLQAELDSGSVKTAITLPGMLQLGLAAGGGDEVRGFGPGSLAARTQLFPDVQIATSAPAPAELLVAPLHTLRSIGGLIGADWLGSRRIWLSWATNQVFVAEP